MEGCKHPPSTLVTLFSMDLFNFLSGRKVSLCFALQGIFKKVSGKPKSSNVIQKDKKDFGSFIFQNNLFLAVLSLHCFAQALSSCGTWASHCCGFSCFRAPTRSLRGLQWLWLMGLSSSLVSGIFPSLAGGFLSTGPPGKSGFWKF